MRPLTDMCIVSREKLAFLVDATAAPIASIVPISSWVGFEISLIQAELDKILEMNPDAKISDSGFGVFLETIKYRYYCIFMLFFIPLLILSKVRTPSYFSHYKHLQIFVESRDLVRLASKFECHLAPA